VSDLNRREQNDAANGKGGDKIEKRSHGFSPYSNARQTSLFLRNLQGPDGRNGSGFQLKTEINVLHILQLDRPNIPPGMPFLRNGSDDCKRKQWPTPRRARTAQKLASQRI
jgi:hypothetical protein